MGIAGESKNRGLMHFLKYEAHVAQEMPPVDAPLPTPCYASTKLMLLR